MKLLSDGTAVTSRSYYFLLDWNEQNLWAFMFNSFDKEKLCDLTIAEYYTLWDYATDKELEVFKLKL